MQLVALQLDDIHAMLKNLRYQRYPRDHGKIIPTVQQEILLGVLIRC